MNQNIKNTLYRFTTMRVPQAVKEEVKENFFVSRPVNQTNSKFFGMEPFTTVTEGVVAAHNTVFNTMDNLKTEFGTFYDFAIWLTRNRMTVTETEARAAFNSVQKYKTGIRKTEDATVLAGLWNDLHYYALTLKNSKVRDAIISILTANDFYFKVISKTSSMTEEFVRGVAQARVILDLKPVVKGNPPKKTEMLGKEEKIEILKKHHFLTAKANLYEISQRKKEILKAKEIFEQGEARKRKEADADYEEAVKAAYAAATYTERVVTDSESAESIVVKEYTNLVLPDYADFYVRPADELTITTPKSYYSQNSISFVSQLKTDYEYLTYDEILSFLSKETEIQNGKLLENSSKPKSLVVFNGIPFQKKSSQLQNIEKLDYLAVGLIPLPQKDQYYLVIENLDADQIESAEYSLTRFPVNGTRSEIEDSSVNALQLNLPVSGTTLLFDDTVEIKAGRMSLSATLILTNGDELTFEVNEKSLETFIKGVNVSLEVEKAANPSDTQIQVNARKIYGLTQLGIADYRKVEQEVCCYVPGEVSHIENIMAREYKSRSSTRRKMTEITETFTKEIESEQLTDTTMVDRFEMNQEIALISAQDTAIGVNAGVSYGTGNMNAFVNGSFASNTSTEESNSQAITHAKEITERALDRVVQKVKEERIKKVVEEFTDSNVHEYDNTKGDNHISGVYRWVDKIYNNKLINYGKRLMYEFMIPEPSSFHNEAILSLTNSGDVEQLPPPIDPRYAGDESLWLDTDNFVSISKFWASYYNAEITPMPAESIVIGKEITHGNADGGLSLEPSVINHEGPSSVRTDLELPEEYIVKKVHFKFVTTPPHGGSHNHFHLLIGNKKYETGDEFLEDTYTASGQDLPSYHKGKLPVSFAAWDLGGFALNLSIFCELSDEAMQLWRIQTFNAIIEKYEEAKAAYEEKMAGLNKIVEEKVRMNPGFYRKIEKDVLRKNCMAYLVTEGRIGNGFITGIKENTNNTTTIRVQNNATMEQYASRVKFMEQAFEWDIMSYYFYPFYWAEKSTWSEKYQIQNDDPLFRAFLQSGMARVIVTVRPGFEEAVNWFIATGQVWNGGQVPVINDENFLDIVAEIREPEGEVEETWETRVPTSLTVIQAGTIGLLAEGLPCNEECDGVEDNPIIPQPDVFLENEKTQPLSLRLSEGDMNGENILTQLQ